jgi:integrase
MTFDELLSKYFVFKILRPATITSYTGVVRRVHTQFGVRDINDYTTEDWLKYRTEVLANRSALTWNSIRRHMNAVYNFGIEEGYLLLGNPLKRVKFAPEPQVPPKCVSNADLLCNVEKYVHEGQLYREKNGRSRSMRNVWFWGIYCRVCFYTGMRLGQAVNLIWDDINFYKGEILLRSEHSKTHLEWIVPIPQDVVEELRELRNQVKAAAPQHSTGHSNVFLVSVFQRQNATSIIQTMTQSHTKKFFIGYSILVGQKVGPHRMRHTCATVMVKSVPNMKVAQLMLGHCSIKTTMKYVHPDISEMRRAQETLAQVSRIA